MTFSSPEIRDSFHRLSATTQVLFHGIWSKLAQQGYFLHIEEVDGDDLRVRVVRKPINNVPVDGDFI